MAKNKKKRPKREAIIPPIRAEKAKGWVRISEKKEVEDGVTMTATYWKLIPSLQRPKGGERIRIRRRNARAWCENCHFDQAKDSVIRDMPPLPTTTKEAGTGEVIGRGKKRPRNVRSYCKFEDVWEWQSLEKENAPIRYGPAPRDEATAKEELLRLHEEGKKAEAEAKMWEAARKQLDYHEGLFQQMIHDAKDNAECIIICRDMLEPERNLAHGNPIFTQNGEPGKIVFDVYLNRIRTHLYYRLRVKQEAQSKVQGLLNSQKEFEFTLKDVQGLLKTYGEIYERPALAKAVERGSPIKGVILKAKRSGKGNPILITVDSYSQLENKLKEESSWNTIPLG